MQQQQMMAMNYRQWQQPQGYQFQANQQMSIPKDKIKENSDKTFKKYDRDGSGKLDMNEAAKAIYDIYAMFGKYPNQNDVM